MRWWVYTSWKLSWFWFGKELPGMDYHKTQGFFYDGEAEGPFKLKFLDITITPEALRNKIEAWPKGFKYLDYDVCSQTSERIMFRNLGELPVDILITGGHWNRNTEAGGCPHCGNQTGKKKFDWGFPGVYYGCKGCGKDY